MNITDIGHKIGVCTFHATSRSLSVILPQKNFVKWRQDNEKISPGHFKGEWIGFRQIRSNIECRTVQNLDLLNKR